jgi:hypothetical protein
MKTRIPKTGDRVTVATFRGTATAPPQIRDEDNYWRLIGLSGVVVDGKAIIDSVPTVLGVRVLVQFDEDLLQIGLHAHNELPNSLWIYSEDLRAQDGSAA